MDKKLENSQKVNKKQKLKSLFTYKIAIILIFISIISYSIELLDNWNTIPLTATVLNNDKNSIQVSVYLNGKYIEDYIYTNKSFQVGDKIKVNYVKNPSISANLHFYLRTDNKIIYISTMIIALIIIVFKLVMHYL